MDYDDSVEEHEFRLDFRAWLGAHHPGPEPDASNSDSDHRWKTDWRRTLYDGGWVGVSWPVAYGGRGMSPLYEAIINEELGAAAVANPTGPLNWLGRALLSYGTEQQRQQFLRPLLMGQSEWCQGFSEPGAGSDLASLTTFAGRDGDVYRINGQKLWTSGAQYAEWCLLLCRTDRSVPKHKGLSAIVVPMDTPGVDARPLQQAWGGHRFCEVFFDDAVVPAEHRVGAEGDGWALATTVLSFERGPSELGMVAAWRATLNRLGETASGDADRLLELARCYVATEACRLRLMESLSKRARGGAPGPESSVDKLLMVRAEQALGGLDLNLGAAAAITGQDTAVVSHYLFARASSIYGGAVQIQRNIVAQRILGLPRL